MEAGSKADKIIVLAARCPVMFQNRVYLQLNKTATLLNVFRRKPYKDRNLSDFQFLTNNSPSLSLILGSQSQV